MDKKLLLHDKNRKKNLGWYASGYFNWQDAMRAGSEWPNRVKQLDGFSGGAFYSCMLYENFAGIALEVYKRSHGRKRYFVGVSHKAIVDMLLHGFPDLRAARV